MELQMGVWLGNYTSLRNEPFVLNDEKKDYPPNNKGWKGKKKKSHLIGFKFIKLDILLYTKKHYIKINYI